MFSHDFPPAPRRVCTEEHQYGAPGRAKRLTGAVLMAAAVTVATGCASPPGDLGRAGVASLVEERGLVRDADVASLTADLLAEPLTERAAIQIALVNNPALQASYARLGFGAADIYAAGRLSNPQFGVSVLDPDMAGERDKLSLGLAVSFTDLLTLPARSRMAEKAFSALQQSTGDAVLRTALAAQQAWIDYAAAQQVAELRARIARAGDLSAALAERFHDAGNLSPRELALSRASMSEVRLQSLAAEADVAAARAALAAALGISSGDDWRVDATLPLPAGEEPSLGSLLDAATDMRLDLRAARTYASVLADRRGLVGWSRWLGDLSLGVERERETDGARLQGPTLEWALPLFDQQGDEVLRADAELATALAELRALSIAVDNDVRLARVNVDVARRRVDEFRQRLVPQRIETTRRAQQEYNYMLIGAFELISLKQQEYDTYQAYLEAVRDYWLARSELAAASGAMLPAPAASGEPVPAPPMHPTHHEHGPASHDPVEPIPDDDHAGHAGHDRHADPGEHADHGNHAHHDDHAGHDSTGSADEPAGHDDHGTLPMPGEAHPHPPHHEHHGGEQP